MTQEDDSSERSPDASDVIEGPIGGADLKDPATSGPMGADLEQLEPIDDTPDEAAEDEPA